MSRGTQGNFLTVHVSCYKGNIRQKENYDLIVRIRDLKSTSMDVSYSQIISYLNIMTASIKLKQDFSDQAELIWYDGTIFAYIWNEYL